ncbi:MAG: discoidin domain-containing protein [Dokdonella sp.]
MRPSQDALCLDFDFHGVSGYAAMRRKLPIDYPANYEFSFRVRGDAPDNALQFKLADASGDNVWWVNRPDFTFSHDWTDQRYKKRQVDFAWGPTKDKTLRHSDSVEFTIYAGHGGKGSACFDQLDLRELPVPPASWPRPVARASSERHDASAAAAVDGDATTAWRSRNSGEQNLTLDLGTKREFGGLVLHWSGGAFASRYDIELSDDGTRWRKVRRVDAGNGGVDPLYLPESDARYVRLDLHDGPTALYALADVEIKDLAFGASANSFFSELAKAAPRGRYPRGFYNEQTYWTVVGLDGGHETGLFSEDGALEVARGGFSVEPFVLDEQSNLVSWADGETQQSLLDGYLPIPSVLRRQNGLDLDIEVFAAGTPDKSSLYATYTVTNRSNPTRKITLALAVRPFQVNPSVQFLSTPGGVSPIHDLALESNASGVGRAVYVDGKPRIFPFGAFGYRVAAPAGNDAAQLAKARGDTASPEFGFGSALNAHETFFATTFDAGMVTDRLTQTPRPTTPSAHDDNGLASGALLYSFEIPARESRRIFVQIPMTGANEADQFQLTTDAWFRLIQTRVADQWREKLGHVALRLPAASQPIADTLRTALAHILINRDGAAIRPGTRSYARSWIRDGVMTSDALLRLGREDVARDYLEWYAPYQFSNGKVPCCVDQRGSDPVPENDSQGELIHLADAVYRYGGDRALLERMWPHVDAATRYMDELRSSERTDANRSGERISFYGLMPASISHEGYSAKPMHSYWDDFWALTGYKNAVDIADVLGKPDAAKRLTASRDEFRADLYASIRSAVTAHRIDYLPGSAELGDFDATSTTIALSPAGEQADLPQDLLHHTFERYWKQFVERRDGAQWKDYTPYEWRTVGTFVRLGWRERAQAAIDFFMRDRRPAGWNQWAEVVGRDARESRFIGDMPHGWVASDFIRSTLDLFAYERDADHALVLAAGVPIAWLDGDGVAIERLRTPYGMLSYSLKREGDTLRLKLADTDARMPPGGFVFAGPGLAPSGTARLNGRDVHWTNAQVQIAQAPAELVIRLAQEHTATH